MSIQAMVTGEMIELIYIGGSTPGASREVNVSLVFQQDTKTRLGSMTAYPTRRRTLGGLCCWH
jgi:hypothetical protein